MKAYNLKREVVDCLGSTSVSMATLADHIGVSMRHLYKIKTGETDNPRINELQAIHDWFLTHPRDRV